VRWGGGGAYSAGRGERGRDGARPAVPGHRGRRPAAAAGGTGSQATTVPDAPPPPGVRGGAPEPGARHHPAAGGGSRAAEGWCADAGGRRHRGPAGDVVARAVPSRPAGVRRGAGLPHGRAPPKSPGGRRSEGPGLPADVRAASASDDGPGPYPAASRPDGGGGGTEPAGELRRVRPERAAPAWAIQRPRQGAGAGGAADLPEREPPFQAEARGGGG
jgi:23S rRNA pseudouridine2605 synthase